jgi:gluconolactonase
MAFPNGIALSHDGAKIYVAEYAAKRILSIPSLTSTVPNDLPYVLAATLSGGAGRPDGLTTDAQGNIYAASMDAGEVAVFDSYGRSLGAIGLPPEAGRKVTNVGFSNGFLYITEGDKSQMWRVKLRK